MLKFTPEEVEAWSKDHAAEFDHRIVAGAIEKFLRRHLLLDERRTLLTQAVCNEFSDNGRLAQLMSGHQAALDQVRDEVTHIHEWVGHTTLSAIKCSTGDIVASGLRNGLWSAPKRWRQ